MAIDLKTQQIRQQRTLLQSVTLGAITSGFLIWSVTPFLTQSVSIRYAALAYTLLSGLITSYSASELIKNKRIYTSLDKSEIDDFLHQVAVQQYAQQQQWSSEAVRTDKPLEPRQTNQLGENGSEFVRSEPTEFGLTELSELVEDALNDGYSDSKIIKEVLGYRGDNYTKGKELLNRVKKVIEDKQNGS